MTAWWITPRDPLVVRDGRPNQGRSESVTVPFPTPATVAGVVRTRVGSNADGRFVAHGQLDALRAVALRGPLLARPVDGAIFVPAPRDALVLGEERTRNLRALHPLAASEDSLTDSEAAATLVGLDAEEAIDGKAPSDLPAWWRWESLARWLSCDGASADELLDGGLRALPQEHRMHVKLGAAGVAEESMLFETAGLRFIGADARDLAMLVDVTLGAGQSLRAGVGPFAGERRIVHWREARGMLPAMPDAVHSHLARVDERVRVRVILLTPGSFLAGSMPSFSEGSALGSRNGVKVHPHASIIPRPETISGWDIAVGAPKPTRRLVAAGSVLWLDLDGTPDARRAWAQDVWMQNVSDDDQSRRDGFGLAALGVA